MELKEWEIEGENDGRFTPSVHSFSSIRGDGLVDDENTSILV